jgi:hypothetical protein
MVEDGTYNRERGDKGRGLILLIADSSLVGLAQPRNTRCQSALSGLFPST